MNDTKGVGDINSNEKGSGARFNTGKPAMELIPVWIIARQESYFERFRMNSPNYIASEERSEALKILRELGEWQKGYSTIQEVLFGFTTSPWEDCARVFDYGRKKYAAWNWAKGMAWSIPVACIVRHALAILRGETVDPESNLPHRGHIACNIVMLAQYEQTFTEGDDRPLEWLRVDIK